jgi:hypothetical protein
MERRTLDHFQKLSHVFPRARNAASAASWRQKKKSAWPCWKVRRINSDQGYLTSEGYNRSGHGGTYFRNRQWYHF